MSQLSLTLETKPFRAKRSRLTGSKSPGLFEPCVSTSLETPVTPTIFGIHASTEEVPQLQEDTRTNPTVMVNTSIPEPTPSRTDSEGFNPPKSIAAKCAPSSAPEIFYGPDGLPLPPGIIAIEDILEDIPTSTPLHFGTGIHLYPSNSEDSQPSSQVPVESIGSLLDRLNMSEQPSTSRTVSSDTIVVELPAATPIMFVGVPSIATSSIARWNPPRGCFDNMVCSHLFVWNNIWNFLC